LNCQCNSGYFPISGNGLCEKCPANTYWTGQSCKMIKKCSDGFYWDNAKSCCVYQNFGCNKNEYWDGANCRCNSGLFFVKSSCSQCSMNTFFDGQFCSNILPIIKCKDPYSYYNGNTCVCIAGYFLFNGQCITCPLQY
jgi:hypothetical protein